MNRDVRYESKADMQHSTHLRLLLGVKRTLDVCFRGAMQFPAGDVRFRGLRGSCRIGIKVVIVREGNLLDLPNLRF